MTPSPASPALDAKGLSKERIELDAEALKAAHDAYAKATVDVPYHICETCEGSGGQGGSPCKDCYGTGNIVDLPDDFDPLASAIVAYLSALSAQERAEPVATLDIFDGRSTTYLEDGAFKLPDGKHALYAASPPVAVRVTADMVKRARECLANAKVTGENPTSQRALEYRLGELLDVLDTPASSVVDDRTGYIAENDQYVGPFIKCTRCGGTELEDRKGFACCRKCGVSYGPVANFPALTKGEPT